VSTKLNRELFLFLTVLHLLLSLVASHDAPQTLYNIVGWGRVRGHDFPAFGASVWRGAFGRAGNAPPQYFPLEQRVMEHLTLLILSIMGGKYETRVTPPPSRGRHRLAVATPLRFCDRSAVINRPIFYKCPSPDFLLGLIIGSRRVPTRFAYTQLTPFSTFHSI